MTNVKTEQKNQIHIKFLAKLKKSATETFQMFTKTYRDKTLSRARVFKWHKRFSVGRNSVEEDERAGRPKSVITDQNISKVHDVIRGDRRLNICALAELVNLDREAVRRIFN
ncbi:protein GVQW3 [Trichonephila clavipes]|nr:protein GVQW3 [Trichonephila clavipes]